MIRIFDIVVAIVCPIGATIVAVEHLPILWASDWPGALVIGAALLSLAVNSVRLAVDP